MDQTTKCRECQRPSGLTFDGKCSTCCGRELLDVAGLAFAKNPHRYGGIENAIRHCAGSVAMQNEALRLHRERIATEARR